jgi:hypothetical protein
MIDPACGDVRRHIIDQALGDRDAVSAAVAAHLGRCPACAAWQAALMSPADALDHVFGPVAPPPWVWRRLRHALGLGRGRAPFMLWATAAAGALAVGLWLALGAAGQAAVQADRATLVAAVWSSEPPVAAYETQGIGGGAWPASMRGADMVCRLKDGHWLVSVLLHNVPAGARLHEEVVAGSGPLTRVVAPVRHTILYVVRVPLGDGPVRYVALWESDVGTRTSLAAWHVRMAPVAQEQPHGPARASSSWYG